MKWNNTTDFTGLSKEKQALLSEMKDALQGLSPTEMLPVFLHYKNLFEKKHIHFSKEEQNYLLTHIKQRNLSAQEQQILQTLQEFM